MLRPIDSGIRCNLRPNFVRLMGGNDQASRGKHDHLSTLISRDYGICGMSSQDMLAEENVTTEIAERHFKHNLWRYLSAAATKAH